MKNGFSIVETMVATLILSGLAIVAMRLFVFAQTSKAAILRDADLDFIKRSILEQTDCTTTYDNSNDSNYTTTLSLGSTSVVIVGLWNSPTVEYVSHLTPTQFRDWTVVAYKDYNGDILVQAARLHTNDKKTSSNSALGLWRDFVNKDNLYVANAIPGTNAIPGKTAKFFDSNNSALLFPQGVTLCSANSSRLRFRSKLKTLFQSMVQRSVFNTNWSAGDGNYSYCNNDEFLWSCSFDGSGMAPDARFQHIGPEFSGNRCVYQMDRLAFGWGVHIIANCIPKN